MARTIRRCSSVAWYGTPAAIGSVRRARRRVQQPTGLVQLAPPPGEPLLARLHRRPVDRGHLHADRPVAARAGVLLHHTLLPAGPDLHPEDHARRVATHRLAEQRLRDLGRGLRVAARQLLAEMLAQGLLVAGEQHGDLPVLSAALK